MNGYSFLFNYPIRRIGQTACYCLCFFSAMALSGEHYKSLGSVDYRIGFSQDVFIIDRSLSRGLTRNHRSATSLPDFSNSKSGWVSQKKVSTFVYKAFEDPKKIAKNAAAMAALGGLDLLGVAKPLKQSIRYLKERTEFDFGSCGKFRLDSLIKAKTCLAGGSSIELNSDYKLDAVSFQFEWPL